MGIVEEIQKIARGMNTIAQSQIEKGGPGSGPRPGGGKRMSDMSSKELHERAAWHKDAASKVTSDMPDYAIVARSHLSQSTRFKNAAKKADEARKTDEAKAKPTYPNYPGHTDYGNFGDRHARDSSGHLD